MMNCWKCKRLIDIPTMFCNFCKIIQPINRKDDYFSYLGFSRQFPLDETDLKNKFRRLQSVVHPDKYAQASDQEKQLSEEHSSFLNSAYKTLNNPFSRANYLLGVLTNDSSGKPATGDFALRIMELNEEIEEMSDKDALQKKLAEVESELNELFSQLDRLFASNNLEKVRRFLDTIRYLNRAKNFIQKKLGQETR